MEVEGGRNNKLTVCIYEFLGASGLVYAVLASGGSDKAVAGTLFILILLAGSVSGAHFNPAVTAAVWLY